MTRFGKSEATLRIRMEILDVVNSWILKIPLFSSFFSRFVERSHLCTQEEESNNFAQNQDTQNPGINYILELLQVQHIQISIFEISIFDIFGHLCIKLHCIKLHWEPYIRNIREIYSVQNPVRTPISPPWHPQSVVSTKIILSKFIRYWEPRHTSRRFQQRV